MTVLQGKGFYIWQIKQCEGGNIDAIAELAQEAGLTHVIIKVADRGQVYQKNQALAGQLTQALRARGVSPWGWQFVCGDDPKAEAQAAVQQIKNLGLDGFIVNAEGQYKEPGKAEAARTYMHTLRGAFPDRPIGLSSYRFPSYHAGLPWQAFLENVTLNLPQAYWQGSHNPALQLRRSLREFVGMTPIRPIVPTGPAFSTLDWAPTSSEILAFMNAVRDSNLSGVNFWSWSAARQYGYWDTIANYQWQTPPPPDKDIAETFVNSLNTRNLDEVLKLYSTDAEHVSAAASEQGLEGVRTWYDQLFQKILPNASFTLTGFSGKGASRHVTWTAVSSAGQVQDGNDALKLADGKIKYHYTVFTITR